MTDNKPSPSTMFPQFSHLPLEIRQKIWRETLPEPRIMHIHLSPSKPGSCTTSPASYGGKHPALLHVDKASRAEGLRFLSPKFGAFWNYDIDSPYFEIKDNADDNVVILSQMRDGMLDKFKNIAIDWMLWRWQMATYSMEFRVTFRDRFNDYEHPVKTINALPNIKKCTFVYTDHTLQKDIVSSEPWSLGPLTEETTLSKDWSAWEASMTGELEKAKSSAGVDSPYGPPPIPKLRDGVQVTVGAIHDRERETLPANKLRRETQGWEMDWFG
ncbi:hypothetical protein VTL71DRAFT_4084 [Oculimacula yallundae]|uniref:2EXR domain-containing protein n=1 Tax=Oculimacula yallundae TaxID=86028 RepID=A0ABR4C4T7_9HELO